MSKKQTKKTTSTSKTHAKTAATGRAATKTRSPTTGGIDEVATSTDGALPTAAATREPEPRLPPPGTVIEKRDRHGKVRCKCTVEDGGIRYSRTVYRSLSAAAMAAAKDLGLKNKTQNGFTFWGLSKPPRPPSNSVEALQRAWERYHGNVSAVIKDGVTDENRVQVAAAFRKQREAITALCNEVA